MLKRRLLGVTAWSIALFLVFFSRDAHASDLSDDALWKLTSVTKHQKCFRFYRQLVERRAYDARPIEPDSLMRSIDALVFHARAIGIFGADLDRQGLLKERTIAVARGSNSDQEHWNDIPDPDNVVNWDASDSRCSEIR